MRVLSIILAALITATIGGCHKSNNDTGTNTTTPNSTQNGNTIAGVLEHHNGPRRDGVYIDSSLTKTSAATFHIDPEFNAEIPGKIYAQLLYVAGGPSGNGIIIAVTESNNVAAFDAITGMQVWNRNLGTPVPLSQLPCGNIDPLGITGTPSIDSASRTIFLDAMTTPDNGTTKKHLIFALSIDDGSTRSGWPVDVSAVVTFGNLTFDSSVQNQRGALGIVNGTLYIPYGGHLGDCGNYRGWLIGVQLGNPAVVHAWATGAPKGGIWAPSGVVSEDSSIFVASGNTSGASTWSGGEALLRFSPGSVFSGQTSDYFAPSNWQALDENDTDIGGVGPVIVDLPGANPEKLLIGLGKDGKIYVVNRTNLGGIGGQVFDAQVASNEIITAAAAYTTTKGTYVVFKGNGSNCPAGQSGDLTAVRLIPGSPPTVETAWCAAQGGQGSPMVTTTDGHSEAIVWSVGAEGDSRLHGFDGDTGEVVYAGGGPGDIIGSVRRYHTPILANGRIYVAADGRVKAFVR